MSDIKPFEGPGFWVELEFADGHKKPFSGPLRDVYGAYDKLEAYESSGQKTADVEEHGKVVKTYSISQVISISRDGKELV